MYKKPYFTEEDPAIIRAFMEAHPLVTLIGVKDSQPAATQVPVLIAGDESGIILRGHILKGSDHHRAFQASANALAIFTSPNCYVSASLYIERLGSTWNYISVHARGSLTLLDDNGTREVITGLMQHFEQGMPKPLGMQALAEDYITHSLKAIAGFELSVEKLETVFKLSQNRDDASYQNIVQHLESRSGSGDAFIAGEMRKARPGLFAQPPTDDSPAH